MGFTKQNWGLSVWIIQSEDQAKQVFQELNGAVSETPLILMQRQMEKDLELIFGVMRDPHFGPCVMCGIGGVFARSHSGCNLCHGPTHPPGGHGYDLSPEKARLLLNGFRGAAPVDRQALGKILVAMGRLAVEVPRHSGDRH